MGSAFERSYQWAVLYMLFDNEHRLALECEMSVVEKGFGRSSYNSSSTAAENEQSFSSNQAAEKRAEETRLQGK